MDKEQIDELSKTTLASYAQKAIGAIHRPSISGLSKIEKRAAGASKAVDKLSKDEDKPSETNKHGDKFWYNKNGERHREGDEPAIEYASGTKYWYKNGELHRDDDKPAAVLAGGQKSWYKHGELHRDDDKPAVEHSDGTKYWYKNGRRYTPGQANESVEESFDASFITEALDRIAISILESNQEQIDELSKTTLASYAKKAAADAKYHGFNAGYAERDDRGAGIKTDDKAHKRLSGVSKAIDKLSKDEDKPSTVDRRGTKYWRNSDGELHRDGDKPALETAQGDKEWYKKGKLHRDGDKPAIEDSNGSKYWYKNGKVHRDGDKPALELRDGTKEWYKNGRRYTPGQANESVEEFERVDEAMNLKHNGTYSYSEVLRHINSGDYEAMHDVERGRQVELRHHSGKRITVNVE